MICIGLILLIVGVEIYLTKVSANRINSCQVEPLVNWAEGRCLSGF